MIKTVFGLKQEMTAAYLGEARVPATKISLPILKVTQIKTTEKDGYQAVQVAFGAKKRTSQPIQGHLKKAGFKDSPRFFREIILSEAVELKAGDTINPVEVVKVGDVVAVQGTSKGKGFAGVIKRWGFHRQPVTHGQSDRTRAPGSIGQTTTPGRIYLGKKMAGRMGSDTVSVQNLKVVKVDVKTGEIWVSGPVPGQKNMPLVLTVTGHVDLGIQEEAPVEEVVVEPTPVEAEVAEPVAEALEAEATADEKTEEVAETTPSEPENQAEKVTEETK